MPDGTTLASGLATDLKAKFPALTNAQATAIASECVNFCAGAWQNELDQMQRQRDVGTAYFHDLQSERNAALTQVDQLRARIISALSAADLATVVQRLQGL